MDALSQIPLTMALFSCTLAAGTTTTISTTGSTHYAINGKGYIKTAITNGATPTTDATTAAAFLPISANQGAVVVIGLDSSGAVKASQGPVVALDSAGNFITAPAFPPVPDTVCPIGYIVLKAGSTAVGTWIFGTNNLSSVTGLTYTFVSVITLTGRPQVA